MFQLILIILKGLGDAEEVDEAEDYVIIPVKNFEIWKCVFQWEKQFPIVFTALRGPKPAPTPSSEIRERHMLVTWYQNGWRSNHNIGSRILLLVGAGGGKFEASRDVNGLATQPELAGSWGAVDLYTDRKKFYNFTKS